MSKMCNVIDVGELSLYDTVSHSEVLAVLRKIAQIDQDYYPENLGVTLVVAAPWSFTAAWSVVKVFLDAKTAAKFKVLGTGAAGVEKLTKVLGEGKVPAFLGGTCVCAPGGCVCCDPRTGETPDVLTTEQVAYARFAVERSTTRLGTGRLGFEPRRAAAAVEVAKSFVVEIFQGDGIKRDDVRSRRQRRARAGEGVRSPRSAHVRGRRDAELVPAPRASLPEEGRG